MPTKPFWQSSTIWSVVALFIASVVQQFHLPIGDLVPRFVPAVANVINTAQPFVLAVVQLVALVMGVVGRFKASTKVTLTNKGNGTLPPGVSGPLLLVLIGFALVNALTGCATTLPEQFQNVTPPLSTTDQKLVLGCESFDTPTALGTIRTSAGTIVSVTMYASIKQTSTMQSDGLLLYGAGQQLQSFTSGSVGSISSVDDILTGVRANASTTQSALNFAAIGEGLDGALATAKTYITNAATSTTNPQVAAYALTVFSDDVHAVGLGICDVTAQYVPTTSISQLPPFRLTGEGTLYAAP